MTLRNEIAALLPQDTFLRIDRTGRALYAAAIDDTCASQLRQAGWTCKISGRICLIAPGTGYLDRMRKDAASAPQWACFAARPTDPAILPLFTAILRALEMPPTPSALQKLDKQLRQTAAIALRTGTGGGLELCQTLFSNIQST